MSRRYEIRIVGRGEVMLYSDGEVELSLDRTYCDGHRLFCDSTSGVHDGLMLSFETRRKIIEDLCDYFNTMENPSTFVLHEEDKDRHALEGLFRDLVMKGNRLVVEYDGAEKQEQRKDNMYLGILKSGKQLSINGVEIRSIEDYWRWKGREK